MEYRQPNGPVGSSRYSFVYVMKRNDGFEIRNVSFGDS